MSGGNQQYGREFGSHSTLNVQRTTDPNEALNQIIQQNGELKRVNLTLGEQLQQAGQQLQDMANEMKDLAKFRQVLQNPIEKLTVELFDGDQLRIIRGHMIQMFGQGGAIDSEGKWAQTVVNTRLQLMIRQLIHVGLQRWPQVQVQLAEIIKQQGLMR